MDIHKTSLERAFDLARSGKFQKVSSLVQRLNAEGYAGQQVEGPRLRKQLMGLIRQAQNTPAEKSAESG
jgi:hypothetical protein